MQTELLSLPEGPALKKMTEVMRILSRANLLKVNYYQVVSQEFTTILLILEEATVARLHELDQCKLTQAHISELLP